MKRVVLLMAVLLTACSLYAQMPAPITGSTFVCIGSSTTLSDATPGGTWTSSSPGVATVGASTGVVTSISLGTTVITYSTLGGYVTRLMTVKDIPTLTPSSFNGCVNSTYTLAPSIPGGSWSSTSPVVATVGSTGLITGIAPGVTNIIYTAAGGCSTTATMTVNSLPAPITGTNYAYTGTATALSDASGGGVWSTSDPFIASVGATTGVVTGISAGYVYISYTLPTTCSSIFRVEIDPLPAQPEMLAWYPFCGDTTDRSGLGNDLSNGGLSTTPATLTLDRFGNPNDAYRFNGASSMMSRPVFFAYSGTPPDFTWSAWINPSGNQSSIIMYNGDPTSDGLGIVMNNGTMGTPGNQVGVYFGMSGNLYASQPITLGIWHHVALIKNGAIYELSIDNTPGVMFVESTNPFYTDPFALGINYHSTLPGFGPLRDAYDGALDDIAIIDRPLTTLERLSIYYFNPSARPFSLGNDTVICADRITLTPSPFTSGGQYTWRRFTAGSGYPIFDTVHTSVTVFPNIGTGNAYVLNVSKPFGCTTTDTIAVTRFSIPVYLGPDIIACVGDTINLTQYYPASHFLWSTGDTTHDINVTSTGTYYVSVDSNYLGSSCIGRDTVNITFHNVPVIGLPDSVTNCQGVPQTLHAHVDPTYTYIWSTGFTTDSLVVTTSGKYWVRVSDSGCIRVDTTQVLLIFDTVTFSVTDTAICRGGRVDIRDRVTVNPLPGISYQWTPTAGISTANVPQPVIKPDTSAWYILKVSYPGCPDILDSFHIDVQPNPTVFLGGNRDVCRGDTIHINAHVDPAWYGHYIYNWAPATSLDCSTCSEVIFTPGDSVKLILTVTTPAYYTGLPVGCKGLDSAWVLVHENNFIDNKAVFELCPGDSVQLIPDSISDQGTSVAYSHWYPSIYLDDPLANKPWVKPITSQTYMLIATSKFGCNDTAIFDVKVHPEAVIHLEDSVTIYPGESYHITPQTNCTYFTWYPPLGLDNEFISDPTATPTVNTVYKVTGITEAGCVTYDSIKIRIDPNSYIAMANAFSPGSPYNSKFYVLKRGTIVLDHFRIFDRWGNMVFETHNIDEGWDGMYNGKPQPFGVYVYEVEGTTSSGKHVKRQGNVTLIR